MESKASKTAELQILAIHDFLGRDGKGPAWLGGGWGGGEGGTKTQRRTRRKETGGVVLTSCSKSGITTTNKSKARNLPMQT